MDVRADHPIIDAVLEQHRDALGAYAATYRNHVYRGLNYHRALLGAPPPDSAALAWAVHDLGIWTSGTFDYLEPSAALAVEPAAQFGVADLDAVRRMVCEHHRLRPVSDRLVETFRVADRIDVSRGLLRSGLPRATLRELTAEFPYLGFHRFLARGLTRHAATHPTRPLPMIRW